MRARDRRAQCQRDTPLVAASQCDRTAAGWLTSTDISGSNGEALRIVKRCAPGEALRPALLVAYSSLKLDQSARGEKTHELAGRAHAAVDEQLGADMGGRQLFAATD